MIAHFTAHRGEIEALVKQYREYRRPPNPPKEWGQLPEVMALKATAGVRAISEVGSIWLPDPYSAKTAGYLFSLAKNDGRAYFQLKRQSGSLAIRLADGRYGPRTAVVETSIATVWKDYFFFPVPPKVEGNALWRPVDTDGSLKRSERVFADLKSYPPAWSKGECVYRSIEPQWFIRMCWGAT